MRFAVTFWWQVVEAARHARGAPHAAPTAHLLQVLDRNVEHLSGGELQRFAIAVVAAQKADVYMIDEPSSYLDVRQRLHAAKVSTSQQAQLSASAVYVLLVAAHPIVAHSMGHPSIGRCLWDCMLTLQLAGCTLPCSAFCMAAYLRGSTRS